MKKVGVNSFHLEATFLLFFHYSFFSYLLPKTFWSHQCCYFFRLLIFSVLNQISDVPVLTASSTFWYCLIDLGVSVCRLRHQLVSLCTKYFSPHQYVFLLKIWIYYYLMRSSTFLNCSLFGIYNYSDFTFM